MRRTLPLYWRGLPVDFEAVVEGLGHSTVHVRLPAGIRLRMLVMPTPIDHRRVRLHLALSARVGRQSHLIGIRRLMARAIA